MDKRIERSNADKVLRRFANKIKNQGFTRTKPTYFVRDAGLVIEFIHIHKYTFGPCFRMHVCIRILNEARDYIALLGPTEAELCAGILFEYTQSEESVESCAETMAKFVVECVEPWYLQWSDRASLLGENSPLYPDQKIDLEAALRGNISDKNTAISRSLLKIA